MPKRTSALSSPPIESAPELQILYMPLTIHITLISLSPWQCRTGEWMLVLNLARAGLILEAAGYQPENIIYTAKCMPLLWSELI